MIILATPHLLSDGYSIFDEELIESLIIFTTILIYVLIDYLYQQRIRESQREINGTNQYIGELNVKLETIDDLFYSDIKQPQTYKEFQETLAYFANTILGIINVPTVHLRIIGKNSKRTLGEFSLDRPHQKNKPLKCGNAELLAGKKPEKQIAIAAKINHDQLAVFCVIPDKDLKKSERTMIQATINLLAMLILSYPGFKK